MMMISVMNGKREMDKVHLPVRQNEESPSPIKFLLF